MNYLKQLTNLKILDFSQTKFQKLEFKKIEKVLEETIFEDPWLGSNKDVFDDITIDKLPNNSFYKNYILDI